MSVFQDQAQHAPGDTALGLFFCVLPWKLAAGKRSA